MGRQSKLRPMPVYMAQISQMAGNNRVRASTNNAQKCTEAVVLLHTGEEKMREQDGNRGQNAGDRL